MSSVMAAAMLDLLIFNERCNPLGYNPVSDLQGTAERESQVTAAANKAQFEAALLQCLLVSFCVYLS